MMSTAKQETHVSGIKTLLGIMFQPGAFLEEKLAHISWGKAYTISGIAFMLFFGQTGLDLLRAGRVDESTAIALVIVGLVFGTLGVGLIGFTAWLLAKIFGSQFTLSDTLRAFGLAYSPTLVYAFFGLLANLFLGWNTAVAFGITGMLWALNPMMATIKKMTADKVGLSVILVTICGFMLLIGWATLGGAS